MTTSKKNTPVEPVATGEQGEVHTATSPRQAALRKGDSGKSPVKSSKKSPGKSSADPKRGANGAAAKISDSTAGHRVGAAAMEHSLSFPARKSAIAEALPETPLMAEILAHGDQVAKLAEILFQKLAPLHRLSETWGRRLLLAAHLHDIGMAEGRKGHHKTGMRLVENNLGLAIDEADRPWVALLVRYHRKACPSRQHAVFAQLERPERDAVRRAASLLRVADALDYTHAGVVKDVEVGIHKRSVTLACQCDVASSAVLAGTEGLPGELVTFLANTVLPPELDRAVRKGDLFRDVFHKKLELSCLPE